MRCQEGTTVILQEVNPFFTQSICVYEDFIGTESHSIEVYRFNSSCDTLPSERSIQRMTKFTNLTNVYLLPGSTLEYDLILNRANYSTDIDNHIIVYLTRGLEMKFDPHQLQGQIIFKGHIPFDSQPYHYSYEIGDNEHGYYNLHFLLPSDPFTYSLNLTFTNVTIDNTGQDDMCGIDNENNCHFKFAFSTSKSCLVADILETDARDPFLDIGLEILAFQLTPVLSITIVMSVCVIVLIVIVAGCASYRVYKKTY